MNEDDLIPQPTAPLQSADFTEQHAISQETLDAQQQQLEAETPSFFEGLKLSRQVDTVAPAVSDIVSDHQFSIDPNFEWDEELWKELTKDLSTAQRERMTQVGSLDEAMHLFGRATAENEAERKLGLLGWSGLGTRFLVSMFDETALAATVASEGVALPWVTASKIGKWGRLGRAALVGGATNAGIESAIAFGKTDPRAEDVILAVGIGALMGGLSFKGIFDNLPEAQDARRALGDMTTRLQDDIITREQGDAFGDGTVGAAMTDRAPAEPFKVDTDYDVLRYKDADGPKYSGLRYSLTAELKRGQTSVEKWMGANLVEDGVEGGAPSAALISHTETDRLLGDYAQIREDAFHEWKQEVWKARPENSDMRWYNIFNDMKARTEFNRLVNLAVRGEKVDSSAIHRVAGKISENNRVTLRMLKEAGVEGFEEVPENSSYLTRIWSNERMDWFNQKFGEKPTIEFIHDAIRRAVPEAHANTTHAIATAIFHRFLKPRGHAVENTQRLFGSAKLDDIKEFLDDLELGPEHTDAVDTLMEQLRRTESASKAGKPNRAKRRVILDETHSDYLKDSSGRMHSVRISDLFEQDADFLHSSYVRQMMGRYALAKKGIKSDSDWEDMIKRFYNERRENHPFDEASEKATIKRFDYVRNTLLGKPNGDDFNSTMSNYMRLLRDASFIRVMNKAGFSQIAEFMAITSVVGFKNTLAHVPELKRMVTRIKDGSMKSADPLLRDIESSIGGFGMHRAIHIPTARFDELGMGGNFGTGKIAKTLGKLDVAQQYMKRVTGDISGLAPLTIVMHRLAAVSMAEKFYQLALKPGTKNMKRLKAMGIDDAMLNRILDNVQKFSTSEKNALTGRKLIGMDYDSWMKTDLESFEAYKFAINREVNRVVQHNLLGETHPLMSTDWGKTLLQFRTFVLGAWEKQTLHNINMADRETLMYTVMATTVGAMAYTAQTYTNSLGMKESERQKYLKDRLDTFELAKAGFQKAGISSLIPPIVDTVLMVGREPFFGSSGRSTGLATNVTGNPSVNTASRLGGSLDAIAGLLTNPDYELSKSNIKDLSVLVPFSNAIGLHNLWNYMQQDLPARSLKPED